MSHPGPRLSYADFARLSPTSASSLLALGGASHGVLETALVELVELRASQINGCAYCLQYHLSLARKAGLAQVKIDLLPTWPEAGVYTPRELAALAWTEHLTRVSDQGAPDTAWAALQAEFNEAEIATLCAAIACINAWNRIAVALRFAPEVG